MYVEEYSSPAGGVKIFQGKIKKPHPFEWNAV
jgi:hypothetical protein